MQPAYVLLQIKRLFREKSRIVTRPAFDGALSVGHGADDMEECICEILEERHFYKSMPSEKMPDLWQDVYKVTFLGVPLYVKIQVRGGRAVLISYKPDESER